MTRSTTTVYDRGEERDSLLKRDPRGRTTPESRGTTDHVSGQDVRRRSVGQRFQRYGVLRVSKGGYRRSCGCRGERCFLTGRSVDHMSPVPLMSSSVIVGGNKIKYFCKRPYVEGHGYTKGTYCTLPPDLRR